MKKIVFIFTIVFLAGMISLISCKEDMEAPSSSTNGTRDARITKKLLDYKQKMNHKSGSNMEIDSAVWYIEGLLNYEEALNDHVFDSTDLYIDSVFFEGQFSTLTFEQISYTYDQFKEFMENLHHI